MGNILSVANLKKTYYYMKKNGLKQTFVGIVERVVYSHYKDYNYMGIVEAERNRQTSKIFEKEYTFSILVPTFETDEIYLTEMIHSVLSQTYHKWELILADASATNQVERVVLRFQDERIRYIKLEGNKGIAENTNEGLRYVTGDYVGLLDHDDLLTEDALYEVQCALKEGVNQKGITYPFIYSDEDKCNGDGTIFYEPHFKLDFNLDLLLTNNYICHFLVMKTSLIKELGFRSAYDGAQDFDLILRAVGFLLVQQEENEHRKRDKVGKKSIFAHADELPVKHIPKVLYHWRCHTGSTAANPQSKSYAYEAGKRAVEDFFAIFSKEVLVWHTSHLGFYRVDYGTDIFKKRKDIGLIGGKVLDKRRRIVGGIYRKDRICPFLEVSHLFSGYMHRISLQQDCFAIDIRNMIFSMELEKVMKTIMLEICEEKNKTDWQVPLQNLLISSIKKSRPYHKKGKEVGHYIKTKTLVWDYSVISKEEWKEISIMVSKKIREMGYTILWDPNL